MSEPASARLFGYAILYRVVPVNPGARPPTFNPVAVDPAAEASSLARELEHHVTGRLRGSADSDAAPDAPELGISLPFGRCGIDGRPREHVRLYCVDEAFLDILEPSGVTCRALAEGETTTVEPGSVVRFRARPRPGHRALIAFQTEDRTPLHGHAAPLTAEGDAPRAEAAARLRQTTAAFEVLWRTLESPDPAPGRERLNRFFADMARRMEGDGQIAAARIAAERSGSYASGDEAAQFDRARDLLTPEVLARIGSGEAPLFRFPGMLGAVAPLFPLVAT